MSGLIINPYGAVPSCEQQPSTDPSFSSVSSLLHFNGTDGSTTFTDVTGKTWTAVGNAQIDTADSKFGGASGLFDGTGDYLSTADHDDFSFGSGDFTIECWLNTTDASTQKGVISKRTNGSSTGLEFLVEKQSGTINCYLWDGSSITTISSAVAIQSNTWHHVAITRSGSTVKIFIDGVEQGSGTFSGTIPNQTSGVRVGGTDTTPTIRTFDGHIDEMRVTKGVARYTSNFIIQCNEFADS